MKKRIFLLSIILLVMTGCTCEYNLTIEGKSYKESITLTGEDTSEVKNFNRSWSVPTDKDKYNLGTDPDSDKNNSSKEVYNYQVSGNNLKFNYDFTEDSYQKSSAVSSCLRTLNIANYEGKTVISTSSNFTCFDKYPTLNKITINVNVDREVTSNNADSVKNKTYTWKITRNNYSNKSINLIFKQSTTSASTTSSSTSPEKPVKKAHDYTIYIFALILIGLIWIGYRMFNKMKEKSDSLE